MPPATESEHSVGITRVWRNLMDSLRAAPVKSETKSEVTLAGFSRILRRSIRANCRTCPAAIRHLHPVLALLVTPSALMLDKSARRAIHVSAVQNNTSKSASFSQTPELTGIEVLRFLCAFSILLFHYKHFFFSGTFNEPEELAILPALPLHWLFRYSYEYGGAPVEVFWAISGYIFYWKYAQPVFDRRVGIVEFATRRFSRLYPLHIATLILVTLLQCAYYPSHGQYFIYADNSALSFLGQLFFASNWFSWQTVSFNGPIWTISVEILIYFAFFCTVRTLGAHWIVALVAMALSFALLHSRLALLVFNKDVFNCAILFFAGGAAQWLSKRRTALLVSVAACAGIAVAALLATHVIDVHFSVVFLAVCLVLLFVRLGEMTSASPLKRIAFLGNATYSSYLIHFPAQLGLVIVLDALGVSRTVFFSPLALVAYLALIISISLAVYHLFELPAQNWIRRRVRRPRIPAPQAFLPTSLD